MCSLHAGIALTVALLIIGDEILAGKIEETNSSFLCRELYAIGWRVVKARTFHQRHLSMICKSRCSTAPHYGFEVLLKWIVQCCKCSFLS